MKVLVVDPAPDSRDALRQAISGDGGQFRGVASLTEARRHLSEYAPDVVVAALDLPDGDPAAFLAEISREVPRRAAWVLAPAAEALDAAVRAMSRGADDFLWRPVSAERVSTLLRTLRDRRQREASAEETRLKLARLEAAGALPGRSARWADAMSAIERLAPERAVLVTGEDGTEKDAAARYLHRLSPRGREPFVRATGDLDEALGRAGAGTIFLPGIDLAPRPIQEKLSDTIEREERPGIVVATDRDPAEAARRGELLPRLLARLEGLVVHLPPLRERGDDVVRLARQFLEETSTTLAFDSEAMEALAAHDWPANVQELREAVRRAAELAEGPTIGPIVVRSVLGRPLAARGSRRRKVPVVRITVGDSLADVERRLIQKTLEFAKGNKKKTAELLKLSLKTIYNKIKEYGLEH